MEIISPRLEEFLVMPFELETLTATRPKLVRTLIAERSHFDLNLAIPYDCNLADTIDENTGLLTLILTPSYIPPATGGISQHVEL